MGGQEEPCGEAPPFLVLVTSTGSESNASEAFGGSFTPLTGTGTWGSPPRDPPIDRCQDFHIVSEELLQSQADDNNVVGCCERCGVRIIFPRIPGAFSFERAGACVGRAMSMDEDDDAGALLAELIHLQDQIEKDQRRYKRALEILEIARVTALKHATKQSTLEK